VTPDEREPQAGVLVVEIDGAGHGREMSGRHDSSSAMRNVRASYHRAPL
jgi:hypothetical protein